MTNWKLTFHVILTLTFGLWYDQLSVLLYCKRMVSFFNSVTVRGDNDWVHVNCNPHKLWPLRSAWPQITRSGGSDVRPICMGASGEEETNEGRGWRCMETVWRREEMHRERYPFKRLNYSSNSALWSRWKSPWWQSQNKEGGVCCCWPRFLSLSLALSCTEAFTSNNSPKDSLGVLLQYHPDFSHLPLSLSLSLCYLSRVSGCGRCVNEYSESAHLLFVTDCVDMMCVSDDSFDPQTMDAQSGRHRACGNSEAALRGWQEEEGAFLPGSKVISIHYHQSSTSTQPTPVWLEPYMRPQFQCKCSL